MCEDCLSLKDKLSQLFANANSIANLMNLDLSEEEKDFVYSVADGLTTKFVINCIEGRCSIQQMIDWPVDKLEDLVDRELLRIQDICRRLGIKYP